ncbi:hypothetical protein ACVBAX_21410 [Robertmurraya sp. GLU-23]
MLSEYLEACGLQRNAIITPPMGRSFTLQRFLGVIEERGTGQNIIDKIEEHGLKEDKRAVELYIAGVATRLMIEKAM